MMATLGAVSYTPDIRIPTSAILETRGFPGYESDLDLTARLTMSNSKRLYPRPRPFPSIQMG